MKPTSFFGAPLTDLRPDVEASQAEIERLCGDFRARWNGSDRIRAEDFLEEAVPVGAQDAKLVLRLVQCEIELRRLFGQSPSRDEYTQRFPDIPAETIGDLLLLPAPPPREFNGPLLPPRYRVIRELGRGGIGSVWWVHDRNFDRPLAVKVLHARYRFDRNANLRLDREALLTGALQHPGVPPIHDRGKLVSGSSYFTMKLVEGNTLAELLKEVQSLADQRIFLLGIFEQIAQTVAYAHARQIIHRDLKPQNVMVGKFGEVQLMDWGMAKRLGQESEAEDELLSAKKEEPPVPETLERGETFKGSEDSSFVSSLRTLTRQGDVFGTPAYMSPEQARGDLDDLSERSDVFGLGAILYELLTGSRLYDEIPMERLIPAAARGELQGSLERLEQQELDSDLKELCRLCLAPDAADRPADGREVADRVRGYLESFDKRLRDAEWERRQALLRVAEERKRKWLARALTITVVSAVAIGIAAWLWYQRDQKLRMEQARGERANTLVKALESASVERLPYAVGNLESLRSYVFPQLMSRFREAKERDQQLRYAIALAEFDHVEVDFLADMLGQAPLAELPLIISALGKAPGAAEACIHRAAGAFNNDERIRYALAALNLGDDTALRPIFRHVIQIDRRIALIRLCQVWHGDLEKLIDVATSDPFPIVSYTILCAIAQLPPEQISQIEKDRFTPRLLPLLKSPMASIRAAAEILLKRWNGEIPAYEPGLSIPHRETNWSVNSVGMVMVELPIENRDANAFGYRFLLSDREVTVGQYRQFLEEDTATANRVGEPEAAAYAGQRYLDVMSWREEIGNPTAEQDALPIHSIGYYDALRFCNWLSRREGLEPVYVDQSPDSIRTTFGNRYRDEEWTQNLKADGYRLPEFSEAAFAARGTMVEAEPAKTFLSADRSVRGWFGWYLKNCDELQPVATCLPNVVGLFDMVGNVDEFGNFRRYQQPAPRLIFHWLGGSFLTPYLEFLNQTGSRPQPSLISSEFTGFRVVRIDREYLERSQSFTLKARFQQLQDQALAPNEIDDQYRLVQQLTTLGIELSENGNHRLAIDAYAIANRLATAVIDSEAPGKLGESCRLTRGGNGVNMAIDMETLDWLEKASQSLAAAKSDLEQVAQLGDSRSDTAKRFLQNCERVTARVQLRQAEVMGSHWSENYRDGARGVELAQAAIRVLGEEDPGRLQILAAAYAEHGQFDLAVENQRRAIELLPADDPQVDAFHSRLRYYQREEAWHDPRIATPVDPLTDK